MNETAQHQIALEFGYPKNIVKGCLAKKKFHSAGSFLEYLDTHNDDLEQEVEEEVDLGREDIEEEKDAPTEDLKELSLKEETENLYREAYCLICCKNKRSIVVLPCCHFIMCAICESVTRLCPVRYCKAKIASCIHTYGM